MLMHLGTSIVPAVCLLSALLWLSLVACRLSLHRCTAPALSLSLSKRLASTPGPPRPTGPAVFLVASTEYRVSLLSLSVAAPALLIYIGIGLPYLYLIIARVLIVGRHKSNLEHHESSLFVGKLSLLSRFTLSIAPAPAPAPIHQSVIVPAAVTLEHKLFHSLALYSLVSSP
ncbi:hypothetical protein B0H67DRAFT_372334 [Lasiosphaeris hirsuta]|uniref:Uncharacterized protein n=1 Tax=Lasiosphaeris hirsuta TaxID=260670 RepID=A0AA39ZWX0_9PEZI|nr:hypothetical protein B0H67DRAFT_372334 [Lasiosphaeris hirsuta]